MAEKRASLGRSRVYLWGITPLFYKMLPDANVLELLAQRLFWSIPLLLLLRLLFKTERRGSRFGKINALCSAAY